jgi:hypothetical protein
MLRSMGTFCATVLYYCVHYSSLVLAGRRGKTKRGERRRERERERSAGASSGHVRTVLGLGSCLDLKRWEVHVLSHETGSFIGGWSGFVFFCCGTSVSGVFGFREREEERRGEKRAD